MCQDENCLISQANVAATNQSLAIFEKQESSITGHSQMINLAERHAQEFLAAESRLENPLLSLGDEEEVNNANHQEKLTSQKATENENGSGLYPSTLKKKRQSSTYSGQF